MSTIEAPTPPQHITALQRANRVRLARAELKGKIARGEVSAASVLIDRPWEAETMSIYDLLTSQHRWGRSRARRFCLSVSILEGKHLGALTERQRLEVVARLNGITP